MIVRHLIEIYTLSKKIELDVEIYWDKHLILKKMRVRHLIEIYWDKYLILQNWVRHRDI